MKTNIRQVEGVPALYLEMCDRINSRNTELLAARNRGHKAAMLVAVSSLRAQAAALEEALQNHLKQN